MDFVIPYQAFQLELAHLENQMIFILQYKHVCMREDIFEIMTSLAQTQTDEELITRLKQLMVLVRLIAPQLFELYVIQNRIITARGFYGDDYFLHLPLYELNVRKHELETEVSNLDSL